MAYVFNPYTHGLDFTDKRILEPLEQDFADLVVQANANESRSKTNRNKINNNIIPDITDLQAANTAIHARVLTLESTDITNHHPRITVLETDYTTLHGKVHTDHDPRITVLETSNSSVWTQVFTHNTPNIALLQSSNTTLWTQVFTHNTPNIADLQASNTSIHTMLSQITLDVANLVSDMSNTSNHIANLYANIIHGTPLPPL